MTEEDIFAPWTGSSCSRVMIKMSYCLDYASGILTTFLFLRIMLYVALFKFSFV